MELPGDGATTNFEFSFDGGYISPDHIAVTLIDADGVESLTSFTWVGPYTVQVTPAPAIDTVIRIRRLTPNIPLVDFGQGAVINEANLDKVVQQAVYAAADAADSALIAVDELREGVTSFRLWQASALAEWVSPALLTTLPATFKGDKGDDGDPSTVPGPVGPAPALTIGVVSNVATGQPATAALRPNGTGAYLLDLGLPTGATGSGSSVTWGGVLGNIADQSDLITILDDKAELTDLTNYATLTDLDNGLAGKSPVGHAHAWGEITGKPATFTPAAHAHAIGDVTGLQAALDGKQAAGSYASGTHNHDATYAKKATVSTLAPSGGADGDVWYKV